MSKDSFLTQQFINGEWRTGNGPRSLEVKDPFTHKTVTTFQIASKQDLDDAYKAAAEAQKSWAMQPYAVRRQLFEKIYTWLDKNHEELVSYLTKEGGSTRLKAEFELGLVSDFARTAAALTTSQVGEILVSPDPEKENLLYHVPVGVVGVISPFNAPFFLSLRPIMPALALGNAVVLKPHERTPIMSGTMIARMFEECGLPAGLLNVVVTDIEEIGDMFVEHPVPEVISFTGSYPTGRHIAEVAGRNLKKAIMELGGNSAFVVLEDADIDQAVNAAVFSRFTHSGQICMSANRVIVHESVYDEFVEKYVKKASSLPTGDPSNPSTIVGPLIDGQQTELLDEQVADAVDKGARLALAAKPREEGSLVCTPIVMADVTKDNPITKVEMFGPAVAIMKAKDDTEAIELANDTPYGLSGAVHSKNIDRAVTVAKQIHTGMIHVNNGTIADEAAVPFGGVGASGSGRLNGAANIEAFTRPLWVSVHRGQARFPY
ncbi:MAG TPA: aldehyde dehydrogenase family protein [Candidatus Saccharimonadales bacterium]|nr:aldehyde dehydrogenase family protein [Candidatus Saccharimonadales bacterium]